MASQSPQRSYAGARRAALRLLAGAFFLSGTVVWATAPASALSEIKQEQATPPPAAESVEQEPLPPVHTVPDPDPIQTTPQGTDEPPQPAEEEAVPGEDESGQIGRPVIDPNAPLPEIIYDLDRLPSQVKRMRELIVEAAQSGNIEALRPLIGNGPDGTQIALGGVDGDPIEFLKGLSGDEEGQELLAILEEVLNAGYVHLDAGKPGELYVWPYFIAVPLDRLDARQKVELFKIVTAGDLEDMKTYGTYIFYRVGISPEGKWEFFVAGD
ncbi:hypothetical protein [Mesorhizobium sp. L-8-3]|uniref:hypothetical protein n=1 Tax=Mesorhizobium sp. L-8-3 TaxID=2744522 RepID=UPI0019356BDB|nr:hypothetical protein [Mesorhizobium sp. L-8-3]BCH25870.1 hypothetical protein MesoLjLb_56550 [Mesorhizobium sp. L-8-3]